MKTFDFDWTPFLDLVPTWELLPMPCREFFLFRLRNQPPDAAVG